MPSSRRSFVKTLAGTAAGGLAASYTSPALAQAQPKRKPNILFILADDLGYGDLGCYGQEIIKTPNLDRLASEGIRFTDCYAGSTVCAPSRCSLMTGLHTGHCYIRGNSRIPIRPEDLTVAEVLKKAGYTTGLIGKWGLGNADSTGIPNRQGFDEFFGYLDQGHAHNYYPEHLWRNEEMVELQPNLGMGRRIYSHDLFTEEALKFIEKHHRKPFFLYLAFTIPHANNERGRAEGDGMEVPEYCDYENKDWPNPHKGHAAMIERMDRDVGKILDQLRDLGVEENTIVFFTSDNGPHKEGGADPAFFKSGGPLRGHKRDLYEGGIRVPGIVRWKGTIEPGQTSGHPWANWDFLPTAADLAGVSSPEGIDGISIAPTLIGGEQKQHDFLYWEFHEKRFVQAVRMGAWKGVRYGLDWPLELFDLTKDLGEDNDIALQHPDIVKQIEAYLETARTESEHWKVNAA
jgi:arylsulfatase A-like enzyme